MPSRIRQGSTVMLFVAMQLLGYYSGGCAGPNREKVSVADREATAREPDIVRAPVCNTYMLIDPRTVSAGVSGTLDDEACPALLPILLMELRAEDVVYRRRAAWTLACWSHKYQLLACEGLCERLEDPDPAVRLYAATALARSGSQGCLKLVEVVRTGSQKAAVSAAAVLSAVDVPDGGLREEMLSQLSEVDKARRGSPALDALVRRVVKSLRNGDRS